MSCGGFPSQVRMCAIVCTCEALPKYRPETTSSKSCRRKGFSRIRLWRPNRNNEGRRTYSPRKQIVAWCPCRRSPSPLQGMLPALVRLRACAQARAFVFNMLGTGARCVWVTVPGSRTCEGDAVCHEVPTGSGLPLSVVGRGETKSVSMFALAVDLHCFATDALSVSCIIVACPDAQGFDELWEHICCILRFCVARSAGCSWGWRGGPVSKTPRTRLLQSRIRRNMFAAKPLRVRTCVAHAWALYRVLDLCAGTIAIVLGRWQASLLRRLAARPS